MGVVVTRGSNRISINDEFSTLSEKSTLANAAESFGKGDISLIVIQDKKEKISGIITIDRYLEVISEGMAATTMCRDIMTTSFFVTNRESSPIEIGEKIRGKEVDAVLTQDANGKLHGFFSPSDLRSLGVDLSVPVRKIQSTDLLVDVVNIRDSFVLAPFRSTLAFAAAKLHSKQIKAVLVQGKKKGIVGVVRENEFINACAEGADSDKALARDYCSDNIVRIREDTPVGEAMNIIDKHDPHAVIILGENSRFLGYVSPSDIRSIEIRSEMHEVSPILTPNVNSELLDILIEPELVEQPVMPAPPPRPSMLDVQELEVEEVNNELLEGIAKVSIDSFIQTLRQVMSGGQTSDVVWTEDGSEVIVHTDTLQINAQTGLLTISVEMSCDQTGRSTVTVKFFIGDQEDLSNLVGVKEESPDGPPILVGRWAQPLQDVVWSVLLEQGEMISSSDGATLRGVGAGDDAIWYSDSNAKMHNEIKSATQGGRA